MKKVEWHTAGVLLIQSSRIGNDQILWHIICKFVLPMGSRVPSAPSNKKQDNFDKVHTGNVAK
jgi:hypothetical protein